MITSASGLGNKMEELENLNESMVFLKLARNQLHMSRKPRTAASKFSWYLSGPLSAAMDAFLFFILFFSCFSFLSTYASETNFSTLQCSTGVPDIQLPFQVSSKHYDHLGFKIFCEENTTMIHFPSYGNLVVKSISYDMSKLDLLDPRNCVHEVFLNLNLSLTPFQYYYSVKNYTYLNCSTSLPPPFLQVPCLSGARHHIYTVESSVAVTASCRIVKTVAIPFSYSPYIADNSFGLGLTWSLPGCEDCEAKEGLQTEFVSIAQDEGLLMKSMKVLLCILTVMTLVSIKAYSSKKLKVWRDDENLLEVLMGS